jgi:glutamate N-acetyltransferase/amino-acid N-acetyltransferase
MKIKSIEGGICAVEGVKTAGIRKGKHGLALITGGGPAACVYTKNRFKSASLLVTKKHLEAGGICNAVIINSGCANAFTGDDGIHDAEEVCKLVADHLNIPDETVLFASTGVIGVRLDMDLIREEVDLIKNGLATSPEAGKAVAEAIMTTDTCPKEVAVEIKGLDAFRIGGVAKGAGMIAPDMATMLAFIYTDATFGHETLQSTLKEAVDRSFNMAVVDGDMSTNDMVLLVSTEKKSDIASEEFQEGLNYVCESLAKMIASDGEGATKLIEVVVKGAATKADATKAVKAILKSPLVKTAIFGADPNWGRIACAIGYSGAKAQKNTLTIEFAAAGSKVCILDKGSVIDASELAAKILKEKEVTIIADLGLGQEEAKGWGCDLSYEYVRINAEYTS